MHARLLVKHLAVSQLGKVLVVAVVADDATGRHAQHDTVGEVGAGGGATICKGV